MRMLRGVDESGIESIAEAASVELARHLVLETWSWGYTKMVGL